MTLLPLDLSPSVGIAAAVFGLGVLVWWRNKWARGNVVFAILAMVFALWSSVDWFKALQATALPDQATAWRLLFYFSATVGPALVLHATSIIGVRPFRLKGWLAYAASLILFGLIVSSTLIRQADPSQFLGYFLSDIGMIATILFYIGTFGAVAVRLLPVLYSASSALLDRRRAVYGFFILSLFLLAGLSQFVACPIPGGVIITVLAGAFFLVSSMAFIRVRLLDADITAIEAFLLILASASLVVVMQARTAFDAFLSLVGALAVAVFGLMSVSAVRTGLTKRRELERMNRELISIDADKTDFVAMVAHQLRGPLGGIRFASDMLMRGDYGPLSEPAQNVIGLMKNSANRLLSLSETALNAARSDAGVFRTVRTVTDVTAEVRTLLVEIEPYAHAKGLKLESSFTGVPPRLTIDREILRNTVFNLVDNAVKYTQAGSVDVDAAYADGRLTVTVSDTGSGMTEDEIHGLFQRFHQGASGRANHREGMGLGLFVVKKLMDAAGGSVRAESEGLGKGSTFTMELPCSP